VPPPVFYRIGVPQRQPLATEGLPNE
jgi:hypothetical protein